MCIYPQEIAGTRIIVKDRKKAYAMEEEILSRGKSEPRCYPGDLNHSSHQTVGPAALYIP